jgi:eukaryotic-like serine/threonine-protein kinase
MPDSDWNRVQEVFLAAAELASDERRRFLDSACGEDPALRCEVESLLTYDESKGREISDAVESEVESLIGDPAAGSRFGPWRVVREIGRGGMGTVYLAVRDDAQFHQTAALKLVRYGMDTAELLDRFRRERQILANLDHPYIARLIDGGSTPQGRPYLVMEYVEGQTIEAWCAARNLSIADRCRLMLKVCEAVSYAHRNLVVHRDLKPGNILIVEDGSPKLLDFGVAKLLAPESDAEAKLTIPWARPLTPAYASPEQVRGQAVTTATDVYSLGAILYELLSGSQAHRIGSPSPVEVERVICRTTLLRPSAAIADQVPGASRLRRQLSGDLDNIVLMAMRREPERRYSSADEFAADLRRQLAGRPVRARPDSVGYRAGKFARRNRLALVAAALVMLSLIGGMVASLAEARRADVARRAAENLRLVAEREHQSADRQRDSAVRERARAESEAARARLEEQRAQERLSAMVALANRSLFDIHSQIEHLPGATEARRSIVRSTLQYLEELARGAQDDERLRLAVAAGYLKLGDVQGYPLGPSLGDTVGALSSYRKAQEFLMPLRREHPLDPQVLAIRVDLARRMGAILEQAGKRDQELGYLRAAVPDAIALARLRPNDPDSREREGLIYESMAEAVRLRDTRESLVWSRKCLASFTALAARFPDRDSVLKGVSDAHSQRGTLLNTMGDVRGSIAELKECAAVRERLVARHPHDVVYRRNLMLIYAHIGAVLGSPLVPSMGDLEGARAWYRKAVAIAEESARGDPADLTAQYDVGAATLRLATVDVPPSGLPESLALLRKAETIIESALRASPDSLRYKRDLALAWEYIGHRLRALGRVPEALEAYRRALALSEEMLAVQVADRGAYSEALASGAAVALALAMEGNRQAALDQARATMQRAQGSAAAADDPVLRRYHVAKTWVRMARVYQALSKHGNSPRADMAAAQAAAEHAIDEIHTAAAAGNDATYVLVIKEAQAMIAECDAAGSSAPRR